MRPKISINVFHFLFVFSLLFSLIFPQSLRDLKSLNSELDILKSELIDTVEDTKSLSVETEDETLDAEAIDVVSLTPSEISDDIDDLYFGYNYFKSEIDFFANVPDPANYILGPGDEIIISLWGEMNARESFIINKNGQVFYDGVGFISISNMTIPKAEEILILELGKIYSTLQKDSQSTNLSIELGRLKSINIFVAGMVVKPGIHLIHPFSDIFTALVQSGGIDLNGSLRTIQVIRNNEVISNIDLYEFFNKGNRSGIDVKLLDGDVIYVPPVKNRVEVIGEVLRPGYYEFISNETPKDIISFAAGLTSKAANYLLIDKIIPINERLSDDNSKLSLNIKYLDSNSILLNDGDKIYISRIFEVDNYIQIFGRVKNPGKFAASNSNLKNLLDLAGGFDDAIFRKTIDDEKIIILRKDKNQFYAKEFIVRYDDASQFKIQEGDKIFVYEDTNYRNSLSYSIEGEVSRPGTYPLSGELSIAEAINIAGGITEIGSINSISIKKLFIRIDEEGELITEEELVGNIDLTSNLSDGDIINILPQTNVVRVDGNVYNPGLIGLSSGRTSVSDAIELAGGYRPNSLTKSTYVIRANGQIEKVVFGGRGKKVFPGDSIFVPVDTEPQDFDITTFLADLSTTLANIAAILVIVDRD